MSQFLNTVKDVTKNYKVYDKWEQAQADKMARKEHLINELNINKNKVDTTQKRAQAVIRATEIMDARSENNCENVEQVVGMLAAIPSTALIFAQEPISKAIGKVYTKKDRNLYKKLTNELSIANTPEAKESLAIKIREIERKITKKQLKTPLLGSVATIGLMFATMVGMILWGNSQQKQASRIGRFQAKQNELKDIENFVVYSPEQLAKAEEIAQNIPDKKEKNNLMQALQELKEMQASRTDYKNWAKQKDSKELEKLSSREVSQEELAKAKEDKELITNIVAEINIKAEEFSENLENAYDTVGILSWLAAAPIAMGVKKVLNKFAYVSQQKGNLISSMVGLMVGLAVSMNGTFEQKNASRIGRYYARKDLINNPHKLISFTDAEMEQAKEIKADKQKKGLLEKIGESFIFLKNYYKQKSEYNKYKKTIQKQNEKLQEAFKQIEITDIQREDAKRLQTNVFRAFDEVDEMSQRYSEDIEASTEIAKSLFTNIWQFATTAGMILVPVGIFKGKIPLLKPLKKLSDMSFKKNSSLKKCIDNLYQAINNKGKNAANEFQKEMCSGNLNSYLEKVENAEIKLAINNLLAEFKTINVSGAINNLEMSKKAGFDEIAEKLLKNHFKQTKLAKWARKFTLEVLKYKHRNLLKNCVHLQIEQAIKDNKKLSKAEIDKLWEEFRKVEVAQGLNLNIENYKTIAYTGLVSLIPGFALMVSIPYMFNAWLTDIQKKAGKIGVMKAMQRLDEPKIFAETKNEN